MRAERVVVVGGGVFGATAALELRRRGYDVSIVDRAPGPHPDASSTDVSKVVRMDYGSDRFYHELAEVALDGWERWNREWEHPLYHGEGFLVLAAGPMEPGGFEYESWRLLRERGYRPERLDSRALRARYPLWNSDAYPDGYLSRRGGWAESGAVVARLLEEGRRLGVEHVVGSVTGLDDDGSRVAGVRMSAGSGREAVLRADRVVVCAGAWTPSLVPSLTPVLRAVAQPVLHFGVDDVEQFRAPGFPPFAADIAGTGWYGFPATKAGFVKLGHHSDGTVVEPHDRGSVSPRHVAAARAFLTRAVPALADAPLVGSRVCLYCDSVDGDLLIGRDPHRDGVVVAAGGSGHAFKFAPQLGALIADAVTGRANRWSRRFQWRTTGEPGTEEARHLTNQGEKDP